LMTMAKKEPKDPFVFVFITNWNGREHLEKLLPGLVKSKYSNFKVHVLDNASTDDSKEFVEKNFPEVEFICNRSNLGYVGNCNRGFREGIKKKADYIALLSNDIIVDERWLPEAVKLLESNRSVGIVGFDILRDPRPSDYKEFLREKKKRTSFSAKEVDNLTGCTLVTRSLILKRLGLFDPGYTMYSEENDFEARVQRAGFSLMKISVPVYHAVEGTDWGKVKLRTSFYAIRNTMRYGLKNKGFFDALLLIGFVFYFACMPFKRVDRRDPTKRRLRPRNAFINFCIVSYAFLWNIFYLPATLKSRFRDNRRADRLRRKMFRDV